VFPSKDGGCGEVQVEVAMVHDCLSMFWDFSLAFRSAGCCWRGRQQRQERVSKPETRLCRLLLARTPTAARYLEKCRSYLFIIYFFLFQLQRTCAWATWRRASALRVGLSPPCATMLCCHYLLSAVIQHF